MVIPGICCERVISVLSFPKFLGSVAQFKRQSNICSIVSVSFPNHISHILTHGVYSLNFIVSPLFC